MSGGLGSSRIAVWSIKHVVAPAHRLVYKLTGHGGARVLLVTTTGRRTGRPRTTPVFFVPAGERYVICNVRPRGERVNPWVLNMRAGGPVTIQVGRRVMSCTARELDDAEVSAYWPKLVSTWPAYQRHYDRSGQRAVFELTPRAG